MAENEKKEERKPVYTKPTTQVDLERRQAEDYESDLVVNRNTVNPNPFGAEDYAGTDPIYQNHADDTHKPLAAGDGPEAKAEKEVKKLYETDGELVDDFGMGGKAKPASATADAGPTVYKVPGQEGYVAPEEGRAAPVQPAKEEEKGEVKSAAERPAPQPPTSPASPQTPPPPAPQQQQQRPTE